MQIEYMQFVLSKLIEEDLIEEKNIIGLDEIVEKVDEYTLRPAITYGSNVDWTNVRREEDWILTLQLFFPHINYMDVRKIAGKIKKAILLKCSSKVINDTIHSVNQIDINSSFNTDYASISILLNVNSKESL